MPGLERRLKAEVAGEVLFDRFTRGRYATDASHYQMMPLGVVVPRTIAEAERAIAIARAEGVSVLPRGGGTSQCGQTVNDVAGHRLLEASRRASSSSTSPAGAAWSSPASCSTSSTAQLQAARPVVSGRHLDRLARHHRRHGRQQFLRRPLAALRQHARQCDCRSTRCWPTAATAHFGPVAPDLSDLPADSPLRPLARDLLAIGAREADEIEARFPKVQRRVGGYNLDALVPGRNDLNLAHILVGSEGTLALLHRDRAEALAAARPARRRRLPFRQLLRGDGRGAAHRQARPDRGRAGRPHHDRAGARHRDVPPDARAVRARRAGRDAAGRVRRGRPGREPAPPDAAAAN